MTIIAGYVRPRGDSVVLWADSAINHPFEVRNSQSSLGELSEGSGGRTTEEGVIKLVQLSPHAAATWAGDAMEGHSFIRHMQPHMTNRRPLRDLLRDGATVVNTSERTTCLFARFLDEPELCAVTFPERHIVEAAIIIDGSPTQQLKKSVLGAIEHGIRAGYTKEQLIAALQAIFLMRSCQSSPFQDGVGGATFGLVITQDGLKWGDDVGWIVLPRDTSQQPTHGIIYIRHGVGIVWSTLVGRAGRALYQFRTQEERERFEAAIGEIKASANVLSAKHVITTMLLSPTAALVDPSAPAPIVQFGRDQILVHPDLVANLLAAPSSDHLWVFPSPPVKHPGEGLITRGVTNLDEARVLAEYIRLEQEYGSIGERYAEVRSALLRQFPNDAWMQEQLAEDPLTDPAP